MNIITKKFSEPVFRTELIVVIGDRVESQKYIHRRFDKYSNIQESHGACHFSIDRGYWVDHLIWLPDLKTGSLVHELSHFVLQSLIERGIDINLRTQEVFCYLMEYYSKTIVNWYYKKTLPKGE